MPPDVVGTGVEVEVEADVAEVDGEGRGRTARGGGGKGEGGMLEGVEKGAGLRAGSVSNSVSLGGGAVEVEARGAAFELVAVAEEPALRLVEGAGVGAEMTSSGCDCS